MIRILFIVSLISAYGVRYFLIRFGFSKEKPARLLRQFFEDAGGAFIKLGQILALRVDILPKEYLLELGDLFDKVKPFPYHEVERIFLSELGATPGKLFKRFESIPFACASFAQVHAAILSDRETVVVKIQRPDIRHIVPTDFLMIDVLSWIADQFFKIDAIPWQIFAKEFKEWTKKELDYHIEAENMQKLSDAVQSQGISHIIIPKAYHRLTTKRIIVQEYIDGIPLSRVLWGLRTGKLTRKQLLAMGIDVTQVPRIIVREILRQYFLDGIFHADPHPGNILLLPNNTIGLIDFGIMGRAAPKRQAFLQFLLVGARSQNESDQQQNIGYYAFEFAGDHIKQMIRSALVATVDETEIDGFIRLLGDHFYQYYQTIDWKIRKDLDEMKIDYSVMLMQILKFFNRYQIKLPEELVVFIRAISIIGLLAKELDREFKMSEVIIDFCREYPPEFFSARDTVMEKRLNREVAIEQLNNWLTYLAELDEGLYQLVNTYVSRYNILAR